MDPGAAWTLPPASDAHTRRMLFFFEGSSLDVASEAMSDPRAVEVRADAPVPLRAGDGGSEILLLQGRPIDEPIAQYGPFVMNTREEIQRAFADYERTRFGGWPWSSQEPVHARGAGRFARRADGKIERGEP